MSVLRNVVFRSDAFNTSETKDYFINECCFGDDLARWLIEQLRARGATATAAGTAGAAAPRPVSMGLFSLLWAMLRRLFSRSR